MSEGLSLGCEMGCWATPQAPLCPDERRNVMKGDETRSCSQDTCGAAGTGAEHYLPPCTFWS